tara:strand:+ start:263 stop:457 length:195 start_codon:yes stop_codon:yes gene_type:complete
MLAELLKNATFGALFKVNLKPVGDRKFLFFTWFEYMFVAILYFFDYLSEDIKKEGILPLSKKIV